MNDPRIAPVEDNLISFYGEMSACPVFTPADLDGAAGYYSDIPFPLCNVVYDARFDGDRVAEQAGAVLAEYVGRALPFLWWTMPSTTSPELEQTLADAGMIRQDVPGMHRDLADPTEITAQGVELRGVESEEDVDALIDVMSVGFEMPPWLHEPFQTMYHSLESPSFINVVARADGHDVACGSAYVTGDTVGLYNIATWPDFRGRGLGSAVTAWLMNEARERGCTEAILHASPDGFPVYERLGFATVAELIQWVWVPA